MEQHIKSKVIQHGVGEQKNINSHKAASFARRRLLVAVLFAEWNFSPSLNGPIEFESCESTKLSILRIRQNDMLLNRFDINEEKEKKNNFAN